MAQVFSVIVGLAAVVWFLIRGGPKTKDLHRRCSSLARRSPVAVAVTVIALAVVMAWLR